MIVPMQKITILSRAADTAATLDALRDIGIVHLKHLQQPRGQDLEQARQLAQNIHKAMEALPSVKETQLFSGHPVHIIDRINQAIEGRRDAMEKLSALQRERDKVLPFGQFEPDAIRYLEANGVQVKLYYAGPKQKFTAPAGTHLAVLSKNRSGTWFVVIGCDDFEMEAEQLPLPPRSLNTIDAEIRHTGAHLDEMDRHMAELGRYRDLLADHAAATQQEISLLEARAGMADAGEIAVIQGYCPADEMQRIREGAQASGWALRIEGPGEDEDIPTLIRNPRWVELIKPVFNFIGVVPGYHEVDISAFFLFFLSIFFALIVGDAGYGLVFLILAITGRIKLKTMDRSFFILLAEMSVFTIIWGVLTGNYFGIPTEYAPFPQLNLHWLDDKNHIMELCFIIGAVHLTLAHGWHFLRRFPDWTAYAQLGWIGTTWTMFFAARTMLLGYPFPDVMYVILGIGGVLIVVFMMHPRNISREWFNLVVFPLNLVGNFVDLVSYIRLFAVGMATYAVASAFNLMSMEIGFSSIITDIEAVLILLFGHTLNIALAGMGVLVHGIRLNVLEFSTHLGMEWTGSRYDPFQHKTAAARDAGDEDVTEVAVRHVQ